MPVRWARRRARRAAYGGALTLAACVSYDPAGPPVPNIDGTYATEIAITLENDFEGRTDTAVAMVTLRDTGYRGWFRGVYRFSDGDSGRVSGELLPPGTLTVTEFGPPPKLFASIGYLRALYAWCDFTRLGTGPLPGELRGDTLLATGHGHVPCRYRPGTLTIELITALDLTLVGVRE